MSKALSVSPSYLCKIEKGIQEPTEKFMDACSDFLNEPRSAIFPDVIVKKMPSENEFKNNLWQIRMDKGLKQNELSKLLECTPSFLSKIEKGFQEPSNKFKKKCARVLKIKESKIFPSL
jgi:transcriptional regulator with XRE-family HTH domain